MQNNHLSYLPVKDNFRLRGDQGTRMDGLTDGIFALAVAVLLISGSVPTNYSELIAFVYDLIPFSICILFIYWIWRALSIYNLRYGLESETSIRLRMVLMFFVLFYIYPLKFLMSWQIKYFSAVFRGEMNERHEELVAMIPFSKISNLMVIYGVGFIAVFLIIYLLYRHAYKLRKFLVLNELEIMETKISMRRYFGLCLIGTVSVFIALISIIIDKSEGSMYAGLAYNLVWIFIIFHKRSVNKQRKSLA